MNFYCIGLDGTFESLIDILVTTPGRLVDHIYSTRGFTLKHLKFIVIDEADRVMDNFQNDWLYHLDNHLNVSGKSFGNKNMLDKVFKVCRRRKDLKQN